MLNLQVNTQHGNIRRDSKLRDDMVRIFEQMYGKKPTIEAIHAGVECGILAGKDRRTLTAYQWDLIFLIFIQRRSI